MFTVALSLLRCSLCFFSFNRMMSSPTSGDTSVARRQLTVGLSRQSTPNKAASLAKQSQRAIIIEAFFLLWCSVKLATDSNTLTSKAITYRSRIKSFMISNLQNLRVLKSILLLANDCLADRLALNDMFFIPFSLYLGILGTSKKLMTWCNVP